MKVYFVNCKVDLSRLKGCIVHGGSSNFIRTFIWLKGSLRLSDMNLVLIIKHLFILSLMLNFFNSMHLRLLLYNFCLILHILSLSLLLIIYQFIHKFFCLDLFWQESWVILFCSQSLHFVLFHHLLDLSLILHSFNLLSLFDQFLFMLWRKEVFLKVLFKNFRLFIICSFESSLVSFKLNVFSSHIFRDFGNLVGIKHYTFIAVAIRVLIFGVHLLLLKTMRKINWSPQSISFFRAQPISVFWGNGVWNLFIRHKVLS